MGARDLNSMTNDELRQEVERQALIKGLTNPQDEVPTNHIRDKRGRIVVYRDTKSRTGSNKGPDLLTPRLTKPSGNQGAFDGPITDGLGVPLNPVAPSGRGGDPGGQRTNLPAGAALPPVTPGSTGPVTPAPKNDPLAQALVGANAMLLAGKKDTLTTSVGSPLDPGAKQLNRPDGSVTINSKYGTVTSVQAKPGDPVRQALVADPYQNGKLVPFAEATASHMKPENAGGIQAAALDAKEKSLKETADYVQGVQDSNPAVQLQRRLAQWHAGKGLDRDGRRLPDEAAVKTHAATLAEPMDSGAFALTRQILNGGDGGVRKRFNLTVREFRGLKQAGGV
jgi:hypothetical protein